MTRRGPSVRASHPRSMCASGSAWAPGIVALLSSAAAGIGCNTTSPAKDASGDHVDAGVAAQPATAPSASASPTPRAGSSAGPACASDADCRTFSSYCNELPCACLVLGKGAPDPTCAGPSSVRCLVDPCGHKTAACQQGQCVLVTGSTH